MGTSKLFKRQSFFNQKVRLKTINRNQKKNIAFRFQGIDDELSFTVSTKRHAIQIMFWIFLMAFQSAIAQEQWFPIGPAAIKNGQTYGAGRVEVSGRATVIAVNPFNPQDVWMGASNGGVWHSTNAGLPGMNWKPMTDALPSLAIGAITLQDCNSTRCNTIYIGTGENNIRRHTYYGRGLIYRQT